MKVTTKNGHIFNAHRCYKNGADGTLNIALYNTTMRDAVPIFSNPQETMRIVCEDDEGQLHEFLGYNALGLVTIESEINGIYMAFHKE